MILPLPRCKTDVDSDGEASVFFNPMGTASILHKGVQFLQYIQGQRTGRAAVVQNTDNHK